MDFMSSSDDDKGYELGAEGLVSLPIEPAIQTKVVLRRSSIAAFHAEPPPADLKAEKPYELFDLGNDFTVPAGFVGSEAPSTRERPFPDNFDPYNDMWASYNRQPYIK